MIQTVNNSDFHNAFHRMDRSTQFSYEALNMLFNYFEEFDENMELDVIAICFEYSEMTPEEIASSYNLDEDEDVLEFLDMNTSVIGETSDGSIVFAQF